MTARTVGYGPPGGRQPPAGAPAAHGYSLMHDGVLGRGGDKWEAHSGSTRPGEFCDFDGTQGRAMRALFAEYSNELV